MRNHIIVQKLIDREVQLDIFQLRGDVSVGCQEAADILENKAPDIPDQAAFFRDGDIDLRRDAAKFLIVNAQKRLRRHGPLLLHRPDGLVPDPQGPVFDRAAQGHLRRAAAAEGRELVIAQKV